MKEYGGPRVEQNRWTEISLFFWVTANPQLNTTTQLSEVTKYDVMHSELVCYSASKMPPYISEFATTRLIQYFHILHFHIFILISSSAVLSGF